MSGSISYLTPFQQAIRNAIGIDPYAQQTAEDPQQLSILDQLLLAEQRSAPQAPSAPGQSAADTLIEISESGTPPGPPAAPGSYLDAGWGLGQIGSRAGNLAMGPIGGAALGAIGTAAGNAVAASRAQEIADQFGLGQMTSPGMAAARGLGQSLAGSVPGLAAGAFGIPGGGLLGQIASSYAPSYNARAELNDRFNEVMAALNVDPYMQMVEQRLLTTAQNAPAPGVQFGMDYAHEFGLNPSMASMDYYTTDFGGMDGATGVGGAGSADSTASSDYGDTGGFGAAKRGGLATPNGFKGPEKFAAGGQVIELQGGGKVAVGPGGGLDDLIPTSINGRRAAALSDGEFVVPADVVSMMGDGSSNAGARRLYDLVRQIREAKTGTARQAGPLPVGEILKRTMS